MTRVTKMVLAAWTLAIAASGAWILYDTLQPASTDAAPGGGTKGLFGTDSPLRAQIGGPFALVDQDGNRRSDGDFRGKPMIVYFGYTYCPDVCPTELAQMAAAIELLGGDAEKIWPVFITVDPERDTPAVLKEYVAQFSPHMVGLTGSPQEIAQAAKAYRVYFAKNKPDSEGVYMMDHSSLFYLMDGEGRFVTHFTPRSKPQDMAAAMRKLLAGPAKQN